MKKEEMIAVIDNEADVTRAMVVGDPVRAFEYQWAEQQALAFKQAGYAGTTPPAVASWSTAKGWSNQQAADDILAAAESFRAAMAGLRQARLVGKERVRSAPEGSAVERNAYEEALATIHAIRRQVGGI